MDVSSLIPAQAADLANRLAPMLGYLVRLTDRMQKRGWKSSDPAYLAAWRARDGMHELHVRLRYASCGPGRAPEPSELGIAVSHFPLPKRSLPRFESLVSPAVSS